MSLLLFTGYLDTRNVEGKICTVSIPNQEVNDIFAGSIRKWAANKLGVMENTLARKTRALRQFNIPFFKNEVKDFLQIRKNIDYFKYLMKGVLYPMNILYYGFHERCPL
eukprot:GHVL01027245.1.p1 GENE.GHVL01027245.1~~GHVL01027245.1.p1  ORF type:complete len:109 (-),score=12.78 GHVL01027245.1:21-347(-)